MVTDEDRKEKPELDSRIVTENKNLGLRNAERTFGWGMSKPVLQRKSVGPRR